MVNENSIMWSLSQPTTELINWYKTEMLSGLRNRISSQLSSEVKSVFISAEIGDNNLIKLLTAKPQKSLILNNWLWRKISAIYDGLPTEEKVSKLKKIKSTLLDVFDYENEISKKKTDWGRVDEFREQYAEAGRQIEDLIKEITESITQTSATELADELANALVEAFEGGENAAKAFGEVANDVIKNAVVNALKLQFLEQPLQKAIKQLQKDMGFDEEGNGSFNGLTETEQARFKQAIQAAGANFAAAMDMYKDLFEQLDEDDPSTLSGAIKGASQESIDLLAGQTNAVRVNQVTSLQLLRQQLTHLANMDTTLGVISGRLLTIINKITNTPTDDLRSQGITD